MQKTIPAALLSGASPSAGTPRKSHQQLRDITRCCDVLDCNGIWSTMGFRRYIAAVVLMLLTTPLFLPSGLADAESAVPACCRRAGSHHCMMSAPQADTSGKTVVRAASRCPYFSQFFSPAVAHEFGIPAHIVFFTDLAPHSGSTAQTEAQARVSEARSHQKRGPPTIALS